MKTFSTLILATLAVAAFVAESADAVQVHAHRGQPVMKKVNLAKHQRPAKLVASDLNEGDGNNALSDPFAEGPIGNTLAFDEEEPPTTKGPLFTESNDGSTDGSNEDSSTDGSNEDSSADGSNEDSSADGSNEDGSADDGSGVTDSSATKPPASKGTDESIEVTEWALFDLESSVAGDDGSGGSQDADEESSSSGSNEEAEGSGSNDDSGSGETTPDGPIGNVQGFDDEDPQQPAGGWGDVTGAGETKEARKAKLHHEQKAAVELAARASADSSAPFGLKGAKPVLLAGAAVGAAVGALAAVMGVMHLRRQQQRDEQSTLAAELPEPQTGREDFEATAASSEPVADELASSSVDLEEALTRESESEEEDAEEGAFANGSTVV